MTPGKVTRSATVDVTVELLDAEPRPRPYGKAMYRPTSLRLSYRTRDGQWVAPRGVFRGVVLKKDGSDSKNVADEVLYDPPEWVFALAAEHLPKDPA